jgi:uncharacterized membrane protein
VAAGPESDAGELTGDTSTGVEPRLAAVLCYIAWWLSGLVFLIIEQRHRGVRFHAAQSIILFGGLSVLIALLSVLSVGMLVVSAAAFQAARIVVSGVWIASIAIWLVLMLRTFKGETWRVPFVGDRASRLVGPDAG